MNEQPTRTQAIKRFLEHNTHADLASLYNHDMEMQCNVAQDGGMRIEGDFKGRQWHGWSDGAQQWKSFRIPYKANSEPEYEDRAINFDLSAHVEGIGMTGWDWKARASRWVAFDFDAITGHSDKHSRKLSEAQLEDVAARLAAVDWCTIRKSTSGKGLHLYVFLDPIVPTSNHSEHAALARAILGQLSALTRHDFASKVDICGGNMWVWHRKMKGTDGLSLIKQGITLGEVPFNWKDHLKVVSGVRKKTLPTFIENQKDERSDVDKWFDELTGQQTRTPLDEEHTKLIEWLREHNCAAWWDQDHWMLVTHTYHLKEVHEALQLRGKFATNAAGTEAPTDHNCFAFPIRRGAWAIRRYTPGVAEDPLWDQDGKGWTRIFFNKEPDLKACARAFDGLEHPAGGYSFKHAEQAKQAAELLGAKVELPPWIMTRKSLLKEHKDGRLIMEIDQNSDDMGLGGMEGWISEKGKYKRVYDVRAREPHELDVSAYDDMLRHIVTPGGDDCGWVIKSDEQWRTEPLTNIKLALTAQGFGPKDLNLVLGMNVLKCWTLVNRPFQDEYPSGREWNRNAAQLRYRPTQNIEGLTFPTWLSILNHIGKGLDSAVKEHAWCKSNGILTGADYIKCWIASLFQVPLEPLPYLFLFGAPNAGKSIFHEALTLLVTHGVVRADQALVSNFNGELANAIVCVIEETDLRRNKIAYNRIKDWVTARQLSIRAMYEAPYMIPNSTHWVQCSNDHLACPIFPGDARIVYIDVGALSPEQLIPKRLLIPKLEKEAPDFLAEVMNLEIPQSPDRLNIPVVTTEAKTVAEEANRSLLEQFVDDNAFYVTGSTIKFSEFYVKFKEWLDPTEVQNWTKIRVGRELPMKYPRGRIMKESGQHFVGNISWIPYNHGDPILPKLVRKGEALEPEGQ